MANKQNQIPFYLQRPLAQVAGLNLGYKKGGYGRNIAEKTIALNKEKAKLVTKGVRQVVSNEVSKYNTILKKNLRLIKKHGVGYDPDKVRSLQRELIAAGYDLGPTGVDGDWGPKSEAAWRQYQAKNNKTSTTKTPNNQTQSTSNEIESISLEKAQQLYQNGTGKVDTYLTGLFHMIMPESVAMPHSSGLKDLVAAEIAYTEGLDKSKREKDPHNIKGGTYIGYGTHGTMSGQSQNINLLGNTNNGAAKVMGGYRYFKNDDGSVDVIDPYAFNVVRDFSRTNSKGDPYVYKLGEEDPYAGREWAGLWHDITSKGIGKTTQNVMENFFTRQGKNRSNNIHFEPGEINRRTNQL